ncbi:hypothetical protein Trydic_g558 [Trypoxylus dichotomus]
MSERSKPTNISVIMTLNQSSNSPAISEDSAHNRVRSPANYLDFSGRKTSEGRPPLRSLNFDGDNTYGGDNSALCVRKLSARSCNSTNAGAFAVDRNKWGTTKDPKQFLS